MDTENEVEPSADEAGTDRPPAPEDDFEAVPCPLAAKIGALLFVAPRPLTVEALAEAANVLPESVEREIERLVQHPQYGKFMRRRTVCHVHDENNESHEGDTVEIIEAPPRSKLKRWDLLRIVSRSQQVDIAAMRAAAEMKQTETGETE